MHEAVLYLVIGLFSGLVMGFLGVGGGIAVILGLLLVAGMPQKLAQGTTLLVVVAPVSILALVEYWRQGHVALVPGLLVIAGFVVGAWVGALLAGQVPSLLLRRVFALGLVVIGIVMFLRTWGIPRVS